MTDARRGARRLLKSDASPPGRLRCVREKDAGSTRSSATCATEDALSPRPVRSGGQGFDLQQPHSQTPVAAQATILLVEDDATISELLAYNLRRAGYNVLCEMNGRAGLQAALAGDLALVLLDLMLPGLDGLTVSREIKRRRPDLPVIMLTARDERETMLEGFAAGADDYVTKPFDLDVLLARIQARLRRADPRDTAEPSAPAAGVPDILDRDAHALLGRRGTLGLKPKEFELLELLLSAPGRLFPREEIVTRVWRQRYLPGSRSLDVHVRRLRDKLAALETGVAIETVRGVGYRLVPCDGGDGADARSPGDDPAPGAADGSDGPHRDGGEL